MLPLLNIGALKGAPKEVPPETQDSPGKAVQYIPVCMQLTPETSLRHAPPSENDKPYFGKSTPSAPALSVLWLIRSLWTQVQSFPFQTSANMRLPRASACTLSHIFNFGVGLVNCRCSLPRAMRLHVASFLYVVEMASFPPLSMFSEHQTPVPISPSNELPYHSGHAIPKCFLCLPRSEDSSPNSHS